MVCYDILKDCPRWMVPEDQLAKGKNKRKSAERLGISGDFIGAQPIPRMWIAQLLLTPQKLIMMLVVLSTSN